ncbi:MAG: response regulator [Planctomycetota bacterium]
MLIAEDEALIAMELERRLERLGYEVCGVVARGEEAVAHAAREDPDVVLLDIRLAGELDGIEAARRIRARAHGAVVFLTAFSDEETIRRATSVEPAGYLLKPLDDRALHATLQAALVHRRLEDALRESNARLEQEVRLRTAELEAANAELELRVAARTADLAESERRAAALFERAPDALVMVDPDGRVALLNRQAEEALGWPRAELLGQPVERLVPAALREGHVAQRRAFFALPPEARHVMGANRPPVRVQRRDGSGFIAEIALSALPGPDGTHVVAAIRDITARLEAARALEGARSALRDAIEGVPEGLLLCDELGRVVVHNQRFLELSPGLGGAIAPGADYARLLREADQRGSLVAGDGAVFLSALLERHARADGEPLLQTLPDGRRLEVRTTRARTGRLVVLTDVTERLRGEAHLREMQRLDALGKLVGGLAHDFNNFLAVIIANLEFVSERLSPDSEEALLIREARLGAGSGAELVKNLLAFARRQPLAPQRARLEDRLQGILALLRRTLGSRVEIRTTLPADLWPVIVDAAQLDSCLLNLANNARAAMPEGGVLEVRAANLRLSRPEPTCDLAPGDYVQLEVQDSGVGMTGEVLERVFEPFFTTRATGEGTGLGLSMVYGFAKQSGGHVALSSEPGQGTTVRMLLPRALEPEVEPAPCCCNETLQVPPLARRILVLDDDPTLRRVLQRVLERDQRWAVRPASTHAEATEVVIAQPLDLVLADATLSGPGAAPELVAACAIQGVSLVVLTGDREAVHPSLAAYAAAILDKPFDPERLPLELERFVSPPCRDPGQGRT